MINVYNLGDVFSRTTRCPSPTKNCFWVCMYGLGGEEWCKCSVNQRLFDISD